MISWAGSPPARSVQATRALVSAASPGGADTVVVGDGGYPRWAHPTAPRARAPGPDHPPFAARCHPQVTPCTWCPSPTPGPWSASIHSPCPPPHPGSPSPRPPGSSGVSGTGTRKSSCARWAPPSGPTRSVRPRSSTASPPTSGPIRGGAKYSPPGPTAWAMDAMRSTGCGPRPPQRTRAPQRHSRPGALDALVVPFPSSGPVSLGCSSIPRPAIRLAPGRDRVPRGPGGPDGHDASAIVEEGPIPFGLGFHPYLSAGAGAVDGAILHCRRATPSTRTTGDSHGNETPVEGTDRDFTTARFVGRSCSTRPSPRGARRRRRGPGQPGGAGWRRRGRPLGGRRLSVPHGVHGRHAGRGAAPPARRRH